MRLAPANTRFPWKVELKTVGLLFLLTLLLLIVGRVNGQQLDSTGCPNPRSAAAPRDLVLMSTPPVYNTGKGWSAGQKTGTTIPQGASIEICEDRVVGFLWSQQRWLRVRWNGKEGWIYEGMLRANRQNIWRFLESFLAPEVLARSSSNVDAQASATSSTLTDPLYIGSFVFMLLGMIAKNIYDMFTRWKARIKMRALVMRTIPALVVSPLIFLALVRDANFTLPSDTSASFLVLFSFAFQNGFFWQDVLAREPQVSAHASRNQVHRRPAGSP